VLLGEPPSTNGIDTGAANHTLRTAPILTGDAVDSLPTHVAPQRAVYGRIIAQHILGFPVKPVSPVVYINSNTPFSGLVCGVQVCVFLS
jgi:hypothetical protein